MRKITNKIISCALSAFMLGEVFVQNADPFLRLPLTVSAETVSAAADADPDAQPAESEGEAAEQEADEPDAPAEEPAAQYEDLVISDRTTKTITAPTEVGNLVIDGSGSVLSLPDQNSILTVHGDVTIRNYGVLRIAKGALTCENLTINTRYYDEALTMTNPNSSLTVNGSFTHASGNLNADYLKTGVITLKGDFNCQSSYFNPAADLTFIMSGDGPQKITMTDYNSRFSTLEIRNTSEEGIYSDYPISASKITGNLGQLHIGIGGENGRTLEEDTVLTGDYTLAAGELDLNGHTLTIEGNLIHAGGRVNLNGGTLNVTGDYLFLAPKLNSEPVAYDQFSEGYLIMTNENDALNIDGDWIVRTRREQTNLTAGTMTIKGNIHKLNYSSDLKMSGTHKVVFAGETEHDVYSDSYAIRFQNVDFGAETVRTDTNVYVYGTLDGSGNTIGGRGSNETEQSIRIAASAKIGEGFSGNVRFAESRTLTEDMHIPGNLYTTSLDLSGYTLTVDGNYYQEWYLNVNKGALKVDGNYIRTNGRAELYMQNEAASIEVKGNFTFTGSYYGYTLNAGTITVGGDFTVNDSSFRPTGTHKIVLNGAEKQKVSVNPIEANINKAVFSNTSKEGVYVEGTLNINEIENTTGCPVKFDEGKYFGETLTEDLTIEGDYELIAGTLDLAGHTMTVKGNLIQDAGKIVINGGTLNVEGDYYLAAAVKNGENVTYTGVTSGTLNMTNENDRVNIGGDFVMKANNSHEALLKDGIMTINGNFRKLDNYVDFRATGNHKVVFAGKTEHEITSSQYAIRFQNVDFGSETIRMDGNTYIYGTLSEDEGCTFIGIGNNETEQSVRLCGSAKLSENHVGNVRFAESRTLTEDMHIQGNLYTTSLDLSGYTLTVDGNYYQEWYLNVNKGALKVDGNYIRTNGRAELYMQNEAASIEVKGNFTFTGSYYGYTLNAGTITVGGDFTVNDSSFRPYGTHKVVLNGAEKQTVRMDSPNSNLNKAVFSNTSEDGIVIVGALNVNEIENTTDCKVTCGDGIMGSKLQSDLTLTGDCYMVAGNFDLNGYTLSVSGSLIQAGGKITVNGGSLEVGKDYLIAAKTVNGEDVTYTAASSGMLIMTNPEDKVHVKGNFITRSSQDHNGSLTNGVMTVEGSFEQRNGSYNNYYATGDHTLILSGTAPQTIVFDSSNRLQNVIFRNTGSTKLNSNVNVYGKLTDETQRVSCNSGQAVYFQNVQQIQGGAFSGYAVFNSNTQTLTEDLTLGGVSIGATVNLDTHKLTARNASLTGTLNFNSGTLEVANNFTFSNYSYITMKDPFASLWVGGDLYASSRNSTAGNLTAGQIEVKGDFIQNGNGPFVTSDDCVVILSGTGSYYGRSIVQSVRFSKMDSQLAFVQFSRPLSEYRFYNSSNALVAVEGGDNDFFTAYKVEFSDTEAPSKVTGLKTAGEQTTSISLTWEPSTDNVAVLGYEIYRNQEKIYTTSETTFTDSALDPETEYSYEVYAFDACRNYAESSGAVTGKTLADTAAPAAPKDLRVLGRTGTSVKLAWNAARDNVRTVGYRVYCDGELAADVTSGLTRKIGDLKTDKDYTFTVTAYDQAGNESEVSESVKATPQIPKVESVSPKNQASFGGAENDITFAFTNLGSKDAVSVQMEYKLAGEEDSAYQPVNGSLISVNTAASLIYYRYRWKTGGLHGDYFLRITLTDEDDNSRPFEVEYLIDASAPAAPKHLTATPQNGTVDLQWDPSVSANCGGYRIFRADADSDEFKEIQKINSAVTVRFVDKDVKEGETYQYQVSAFSKYNIEGDPCKAVSVQVTEDELAPDVQSITPEKSRINGVQSIRVTAADNIGVTRIAMSWHSEADEEDVWNALPETTVSDGSCELKWNTAELADGAYRIRAVAYDAKGNESAHFDKLYEIDNSGPEQVVVDTDACTTAASFISLRWTDIEEPNFGWYAVEQLGENGNYKEVGRTADTAGMHIEKLLAETEYTFRVVAYDDLGNRGEASEPVTLKTTVDSFAPGISAFYPAGNTFNEKIDLSVTAADNIAVEKLVLRYAVEKGEEKEWKDLTELTADTPRADYTFRYSFDLASLDEGMVYVEAVAYDTAGLASEPVVAEYRVDRTAPAAITDLNADGQGGNVHLTWTVSDSDIKHFEIYRAEDGKSQLSKIADCTTKDYYDITIAFDTLYTYQIYAVDIAGNRSEVSNTAIAQAIPDTENPRVLGFVPASGSTVGANPNLSVVAADNNRLANVTVSYQSANDKSGMWQEIGTYKLDSNYQSASFKWNTADLADGVYRMKAVATDMSGNVSEPTDASFAEITLMATAPDAPVLEVTQDNWKIELSWTAEKNDDFYGYKLFRKSEKESEFTWINRNNTYAEQYTDEDVVPGTIYTYYVSIYDQFGNHSESQQINSFAFDKDIIAPTVDLPESMQVLTGSEVLFDGTNSTDNVRITEYYWEFSDDSTAVGSRVFHTFEKAGTYTVFLTARDAAGNSGRDSTVVTVLDPEKYGSVELTAVDQDNAPLKFAYVYLKSNEGGRVTESALKTNSEGKVLISKPLGTYEVSVYKQGYLPSKAEIQINEVSKTKQQKIVVNSGELVTGSLTVHRMSLEEMIEAGVDFNNPSNSHTFRFEIELTFAQEPIPTIIEYVGGGGGGGGGWGGGWAGGWGGGGGGGGCTLSDGSHVQFQPIIPETEEEEEIPPILAYVRTSESISFLKEMYAVDLGVMNNASSEFTIVNSKARLELPSGLSLAATTKNNNHLTQDMGDIPGQQRKTVSWTVRGDKKGEYNVSADFSGTLMPFNVPVYASFKTEQPFSVHVGSGLHLYIYPEEIGYIGDSYYIQYALCNEGSDTIYQLKTSFGLPRDPGQKQKVIIIHPDGTKEVQEDEVPGYVLTDVPNKCQLVPVTYGDQHLEIGMFSPGEAIYGTYMTTFSGDGDPDEVRYRLIDSIVTGLEETDIQVTVSPIPSHITKYNVQIEIVPNKWGDPVDMTTGAFTDEAEAIAVQGALSPIALDLHYNSLNADQCGTVGYGWSHDYETHLEMRGNTVEVYWDSANHATFLSRAAANNEVNGQLLTSNLIRLDAEDHGGYKEFIPLSRGMDGYVLCRELDNTFTLEKPDGSRVYFDENGQMTQIKTNQDQTISLSRTGNAIKVTEDMSGASMTLITNDDGFVTGVRDESGRSAVLAYEDGKLVSLTNPAGDKVNYAYDEKGRLISATVEGEKTPYVINEYDDNNRVTKQYDGVGNVSEFSFETDGSFNMTASCTDRNGETVQFKSDSMGRTLGITDQNGHTTSYAYDTKGNLLAETNAKGKARRFAYDKYGNVTKLYDYDGNVTEMTYDDFGNVTKITGAGGEQSTYKYNSINLITAQTENSGIKRTYTYNNYGQRTSETISGLGTTTYGYTDGRMTSVTDPLDHQKTITYDAAGNVYSETDADGNETVYTYDALGRALSMTNADGTTSYTYDARGNQTSVTDPNGNTTTFFYNGNNQVVKSVDGNGAETTFEYDKEGRLLKTTYADGTTDTKTYDAVGNVLTSVNAKGEKVEYTYDAVDQVISQSVVSGKEKHTTSFTYLANGKLASTTYPDGSTESYEYDLAGRMLSVTDASGNQTVMTYDSNGNMLTSTDAEGNKTVYTYDAYGRVLSMTDPNGNVTTYDEYDVNGNCLQSTLPNGLVVTHTYDALGRLIKSVTGEISILYTYDAAGRVTSYTDAEGHVFTMQYDANGNTVSMTDANGDTIQQNTYDAVNQLTMTEDILGVQTKYEYNQVGQILKTVENLNTTREKTTEYTYDDAGRLLSSTDAENGTASYEYDGFGNITAMVDPNGGKTEYTYDSMGRVLSVLNAIGSKNTYAYNAEGLLESAVNARGQETTYTYYKNGWIKSFTDSLGTVSYTYDGNGNVLTVTDENGTITREYNEMNQVTKYTDFRGQTVEYAYDQLGNLITLTYPGGRIVKYSYYKDGSVKSVTDWDDRTTSYEYDSNGRLTKTTRPDGSVETRGYDKAGRLIRQEDVNGETIINVCDYAYDDAGNITSVSMSNGTEFSSLTNAEMEYDAANRLIKYNGEAVKYDADGNMIYGPVNGVMSELTYDCRNRLTSAGGVSYVYDAENNRISMTNGDSTTYFTYDTVAQVSRVLTAETGDKTVYYVYGTGLVSQEDDENLLYYHFNNLGSTQALTTLDGEVADTFEYGPYGELTSANKYGVLFLYNGEYGVATDANGLYYMRARYYNPEIKRFINQDVVIGEVTNTPSMNRYAYVQGNPISYVDPFGLSPGLGWKFWGHLALNVLGMLTMIPTPVTFAIGAIANIANAAWYASEGDWFSAAGCAVSLFGGAFKLLGAAGKAGQLSSFGCHLHQVMKYASCVGDIALGAYDMYKVGSNIYDKASKGELTFGDVLSATFQVGMDAMQIAGGIDGLGDKVRYCFVAGTPVETEDSQKPIEEIEVGDQVLSQDPVTGDVTYKTVLKTSVNETTELIHVFVGGDEIQTTPSHPFYVAQFGWTDAVNLRAGDVLVLSNGEYVVVEKVQHEILESPVKVYNFDVDDYHTYFVGKEPVLVHNGTCTTGADDATAVVDDAAGQAKKEPYVRYDKSYSSSGPKGKGPNGGRLQAHHGLQQEWAKENLAKYGYSAGKAPTVTIETGVGYPHTAISKAQNARRNARVAAGLPKWGTSLQEELQFIVEDFRNAGFGDDVISKVLDQQYGMLDKLKVPYTKIKL